MNKLDTELAYAAAFDNKLYYHKKKYFCQKSGFIQLHTTYAHVLALRYEADPAVKVFAANTPAFPFYYEKEPYTGFFDFDIKKIDGKRHLVYLAPLAHLTEPQVKAEIAAAQKAAKSLRAHFVALSEPDIFGPNPAYMVSLIRFLLKQPYLDFQPNI